MKAADKLEVVELIEEFFCAHLADSEAGVFAWLEEKKKRLTIEDALENDDG